jgi:GTP-binding protein
VFEISALTREWLTPLVRAVYDHVAAQKNPLIPEPDPRFDEAETGHG